MTLLPPVDQNSPGFPSPTAGHDFGSRVELALAATNHLFNSRNAPRYVAQVLQGVTAVATKLERTTKPFTGVGPRELRERVAAVDLGAPLPDTAAALAELEEVYLKDAVYFHDAKYAAHLNCPVVIPALVGESILSAVNSSMDTWDQSAGATMIERRLIDWTAERLSLGGAADGVFTSGGSQSNFQALLIARNHAVAGLRKLPGNDSSGCRACWRSCGSSPRRTATSASGNRRPCWDWGTTPSCRSRTDLTTGWTRPRWRPHSRRLPTPAWCRWP